MNLYVEYKRIKRRNKKTYFAGSVPRLIHMAGNASAVKLLSSLRVFLLFVYLLRRARGTRRAKTQMLLNCFANSPPGLLLPVLKMQKKKRPPAKRFFIIIITITTICIFVFKTHGRCCAKKNYIWIKRDFFFPTSPVIFLIFYLVFLCFPHVGYPRTPLPASGRKSIPRTPAAFCAYIHVRVYYTHHIIYGVPVGVKICYWYISYRGTASCKKQASLLSRSSSSLSYDYTHAHTHAHPHTHAHVAPVSAPAAVDTR